MAYLQSEKIFASDYNTFATTVNAITNAPTGLTPLPTVGIGDLILGSTWFNLVNRVNQIAIHQSGQPIAGLSNVNVSSGNLIAIIPNLVDGINYISA